MRVSRPPTVTTQPGMNPTTRTPTTHASKKAEMSSSLVSICLADISARIQHDTADKLGTPSEYKPTHTKTSLKPDADNVKNVATVDGIEKRCTAPTTPVTPADTAKATAFQGRVINAAESQSVFVTPNHEPKLTSSTNQTPHNGEFEAGTQHHVQPEGRQPYEGSDVWTRLASTPLKGKCGTCHGVRRRPSQQQMDRRKPAFR